MRGHYTFEVLQCRLVGRSVGRFFVNFHHAVTPLIDDLGLCFFVCIVPQVYIRYFHFDMSTRYIYCTYIYFLYIYIIRICQIYVYYVFNLQYFEYKQVNKIIYVASF